MACGSCGSKTKSRSVSIKPFKKIVAPHVSTNQKLAAIRKIGQTKAK